MGPLIGKGWPSQLMISHFNLRQIRIKPADINISSHIANVGIYITFPLYFFQSKPIYIIGIMAAAERGLWKA